MRIISIITIAVSMAAQVNAKSYAQSVTISLHNKPLKEVFRIIKQQTGFSFFWKENELNKAPSITLNLKNTALQQAIEESLKGTSLTYEIKGKVIVIKRKPILPIQADADYVSPYKLVGGRVTDSTGAPISGVSVTVLTSQKGTTTNEKGIFQIEVNTGDILEFSFVGYVSQRMIVGPSDEINVRLIAEETTLNDLVVIGYGTQKKSDLTGAVGTVNVSKAMAARPVTNVQELLAGTIPGLNIAKSSGAVGSGASINIRGTSTIGGSSGVLVLIDGFPGNIYTLNPNDIESVSVLKDAASASIYGSRAANGVVLVTTKTGSGKGNPSIEINSSVGVQKPQFLLDFVGAADYMKLWDQALVNDGKDPLYGQQGLQDLASGKYADNKWYREIYKKSSLITNHSAAVSGGNDFVIYRLSGSYDYQDGTLPNNNYRKFVIRPDLKIKISDKFSVDANVQYTETYILQPQGGTDIWQSQASRAAPISPIYTKTGQYGIGSSMVNNPVAAVNEGGANKSNYKEFFGVLNLTYTLIRNWNIKGSFARYSIDQRTTDRLESYNLYDDADNIAKKQNIVTTLTESYSNNYRNTLQLATDYSKNVNQHHFKILAGYSQEYFNTNEFSAFRDNLPFDGINVLNTGSQANMQNSGTASDVAIASTFGRLTYDYDNRYLLQMNVRADGSSRFATGHQWGTFPSVSAGWNIHKEKFFKLDWISQLKLRTSWGMLGDAEKVGYYATATVLSYDPGIYGFNGNVVAGAYSNIAIDPNITWERAKQTNVGLDLGLFKQKISVSADYFYNKRDNILYAPPVPLEFGLTGPVKNLLKMDNKGWEFLINYKDGAGDFNWSADLNLSFSMNKVIDLGGTGPWIGDAYTDVGTQLNMPYGLVATGLFRDSNDVKSQDQGPNVFPGNIKYLDVDGNLMIDGNDRKILNSTVPKRYGGGLAFGWKNFDMSVNFYGSFDSYRYISGYEGWAFYLTQNARPWAIDNWTPENSNASYPRLSIQYTSNDSKYSTYWLRKANYLKIQNAQIGYILPAGLIGKSGISFCRLYLSAQNLATITNYPGFDPEGGWYPLSRTFAFGLNLKF